MKHPILVILIALGITVTSAAQSNLYPNEFNLQNVRLLESPFLHAQKLNTQVLLQYDVDRLLAPYLKAAGLQPRAESFSNWDGLDGHVGGHYLSALAIHYAATADPRLKDRLDYVVAELTRCASNRTDGYVGGVPGGDLLWSEIQQGNIQKIWDWWVPWYNVHKIYAGLRDAWLYTGSQQARKLFLGMCDWGLDVTAALTPQQMESMLNNEFGGINEVYADAYAMTGNTRYLDGAKRFTHHQLFDDLAKGIDRLDNRHANTQVPKVIGFQRVAELSDDADYYRAADFFWQTVTTRRSLSFGGNSRREHFAPASDAKSYVDDREGPESCNTNNMLKLTEGLHRMNPLAKYADFYERALFNHILSTQHPRHGGYVYFTSARPGHYRVYSKPNSAMWCCVGTGMENHGKYAQFIYTQQGHDSLYVNLFIPSVLDWSERCVQLTQTTDFPASGKVTYKIATSNGDIPFKLFLRHPGWCDSPTVKVNGIKIAAKANPSGYIPIDRLWRDGDYIELEMPMKFAIEPLNDLPQYVSITRGPIVMASRFDNGTPTPGLIAGDSRWGHIAHGPLVSVFDTPLLIGEADKITDALNRLKPSKTDPLTFVTKRLFKTKDAKTVTLEPFYRIHDSRYCIYYLSMTHGQYKGYLTTERKAEAARLALDARTIDAVNTGEQQPEADHFMQQKSTVSGNFNGEPWRAGSFFSYKLTTNSAVDLMLQLRFWGNETGSRQFAITIDDEEIATVDTAGKWTRDEFVDVQYPIPAHLLQGKTAVTVGFKARPGHTAGAIYHIRLLTPDRQ